MVAQSTKRKEKALSVNNRSNERLVRQTLANKLSGTHLGLWLLVPEYLRTGAWDLLKGSFSPSDPSGMNARMALQMANEAAICQNRIRKKGSLCNQGFSLVNGLSFLASDKTVHEILDGNSVRAYQNLQATLMKLRDLAGHYNNNRLIALDPHRVKSTTRRRMPKKRKSPGRPATKMLQTFFALDALSGQPLGFTVGSSGKSTNAASMQLIKMIEQGGIDNTLFVADKEHFTQQIGDYFCHHPSSDIMMPAIESKRVAKMCKKLQYQPLWAGYAVGETSFNFRSNPNTLRLIVQREGEQSGKYRYKPFLTTSDKNPVELLTKSYPERWTIEEFFNFEGDMGWNRASTFNLNIRYGKQTLALLAQMATSQLKQKLSGPYRNWTAKHTAREVLTNMEGDIRVKGNTIIITYYRDHENLNLKKHFENLPKKLEQEGINPKIPWLFDFKLDFRFK